MASKKIKDYGGPSMQRRTKPKSGKSMKKKAVKSGY